MHLSGDVVLLITYSGDLFTIDKVAEALSKKGVQPFRLDTDKFPLEVQLTAHFEKSKSYHTIECNNHSISTEQVQAVWMRRIWEPKLNQELAPKFRKACVRGSLATLDGFWDSLKGATWVDNLEQIDYASNLDFIVIPSGEYVFLEINPLGEWRMLEKDLNLPIASAIADALLQRKNDQ
jgi:hypothetical protein